jgi:hypothetical protein
MEHQDSYGCRGCSYGHNVLAFTRASARCPRGPRTAEQVGRAGQAPASAHGPSLRGNETRQLALDLGYIPVVPPLRTRIEPWEYDREMYKRRNEVERLFRRLKGYRRIFSRFEKLDVMFLGFISFALIADGLRLC